MGWPPAQGTSRLGREVDKNWEELQEEFDKGPRQGGRHESPWWGASLPLSEGAE